ncbi:Abi family protein [Dyadobacter sp. CY327]|uniref:Abi family protein n=1 Tax=Dyadobacter sp. CY327 TaxID=2907301 RepID=UPI001F2A07A8|nr:Abi family protein [Dyadobacter sp. CY327]MCE7073182.1 Abi family protein [Dyadobacter sp. CY327]
MIVEDPQKALHLLENVSYYRISGYWYPLLADKQLHTFKEGSSFETAFQLYCFDRELRLLISSELEKIEVAVRAKMIYVLSQKYGGFWFENLTLFKDPDKFKGQILGKLKEEYERSDEEFIKAFRDKYSNPFPPSWMIMEIVSFGTLSKLYSQLAPGKEKRDIAQYFGLPDSVFGTWLHSIVYLRNVCAHHSRLWNRGLSIKPQSPHSPRKVWLNNRNVRTDKAYFALSMTKYLLQTVNPKSRFTIKFTQLLSKYPNVDVKAMGFPDNWEKEPLWQSQV